MYRRVDDNPVYGGAYECALRKVGRQRAVGGDEDITVKQAGGVPRVGDVRDGAVAEVSDGEVGGVSHRQWLTVFCVRLSSAA